MTIHDPRPIRAKPDSGNAKSSRTNQLRFTCAACGSPLQPKRSTKSFCSERCRKEARRTADNPHTVADLVIRDQLVARRLVGQIWPVYRWDDVPAVYGLLIPMAIAASELNIPEDHLARILRRFGIAKDEVERKHIEGFYAARKDRRIRRDEALMRTEFRGQVE